MDQLIDFFVWLVTFGWLDNPPYRPSEVKLWEPHTRADWQAVAGRRMLVTILTNAYENGEIIGQRENSPGSFEEIRVLEVAKTGVKVVRHGCPTWCQFGYFRIVEILEDAAV